MGSQLVSSKEPELLLATRLVTEPAVGDEMLSQVPLGNRWGLGSGGRPAASAPQASTECGDSGTDAGSLLGRLEPTLSQTPEIEKKSGFVSGLFQLSKEPQAKLCQAPGAFSRQWCCSARPFSVARKAKGDSGWFPGLSREDNPQRQLEEPCFSHLQSFLPSSLPPSFPCFFSKKSPVLSGPAEINHDAG